MGDGNVVWHSAWVVLWKVFAYRFRAREDDAVLRNCDVILTTNNTVS